MYDDKMLMVGVGSLFIKISMMWIRITFGLDWNSSVLLWIAIDDGDDERLINVGKGKVMMLGSRVLDWNGNDDDDRLIYKRNRLDWQSWLS